MLPLDVMDAEVTTAREDRSGREFRSRQGEPAGVELPPPPLAQLRLAAAGPGPRPPGADRDPRLPALPAAQPTTNVAVLATPEAARPVIGRMPGVTPTAASAMT
ncbi:hypothetical protein ABZZ74_49230 [Streptomyces sp. NPDC006476]|uniref:hypothetical protein n=1 Tax=Streptomyces sp. NPDC006476 TaxID=3157175 RepID=UPI0033B6B206